MKRALIVFATISLSLTQARGQASVIEDSLFSSNLGGYIKLVAVLPPHYKENHDRFTTLYLLHGYGGDYTDWVKRTGLVKYASAYEFIIILPDGRNSWYTNAPATKNANFESYIIDDLIPFVDKKYRTLSTRHGRAIAGCSMGGYGAIKLAVKYPGKFYYAASFSGGLAVPKDSRKGYEHLSPALNVAFGENESEHWTKNFVFALVDSVATTNLPYLYLSIGEDDGLHRFIESSRSLSEKLRGKGALYEYHELPGGHNWVFWDKEIAFLLQKLSLFDPLKP
jgi:S-formylglutathione hydrolase FrmB